MQDDPEKIAAACSNCGTKLVESDAYLARIMRQETHWYCPKGCSPTILERTEPRGTD